VGAGARLPVGRIDARGAAARGHLEMLEWAREHGCPWKEDIDVDPYLDCCALAAGGGHLEMLRWLREHGCPWGEMRVRGRSERVPRVLKWAWEHGCPWAEDLEDPEDRDCCAIAARAPGGAEAEVASGARLHVGRVDVCYSR